MFGKELLLLYIKSSELKKIPNPEMRNSLCKCFTGRLNRLINTLIGLYEEEELEERDIDDLYYLITVLYKT